MSMTVVVVIVLFSLAGWVAFAVERDKTFDAEANRASAVDRAEQATAYAAECRKGREEWEATAKAQAAELARIREVRSEAGRKGARKRAERKAAGPRDAA